MVWLITSETWHVVKMAPGILAQWWVDTRHEGLKKNPEGEGDRTDNFRLDMWLDRILFGTFIFAFWNNRNETRNSVDQGRQILFEEGKILLIIGSTLSGFTVYSKKVAH